MLALSMAGKQTRPAHLLGIALAIALGLGRAHAQANYEGALIGGRSSLMGGTGVAGGTDASSPLQNPATTLGVEGTSFIFSTFFLQFAQRKLDADQNLIGEISKGSSELSEANLRVLPNSTCLFFDLVRKAEGSPGHQKLSVCISEPETQNFSLGSRVAGESVNNVVGYQKRFVSQTFTKKVYALGWALGLSRHVSIGATPMLEEVKFQDTEGIATLVSDASSLENVVGSAGQLANNVITTSASSYAVSALLGIQLKLPGSFRTGISLQTPSLPFAGSYSATRSNQALRANTEEYQEERGSARFTYPVRLALGFAGQIKNVGFEIDGYFHGGQANFAAIEANRQAVALSDGEFTSAGSETVTTNESVRPVVNVGLGVNVPVARTWSIVSGLLTDFGGLDPRRSGARIDSRLFRSRTDLLHGSIGVAWTPKVGSILLGIRGFYGEGDLALTDPRFTPATQIVSKQTQWGLSLVISGQLTLEMIAIADPTGLVQKATKAK